MICSKCGKELADGARFCTVCGTMINGADVTMKLDENDSDVVTIVQQSLEYPTQNPNMMGEALTQNANVMNTFSTQNPSHAEQTAVPAQLKKKKKKNGKKIAVLILVLIILAVGGGCAFILYRMNLPVNKAEDAFSSGDLDAALEYIEEIDDAEDLESVQRQAYSYAEEIKNNYINEVEGVDYEVASSALSRLHEEVLSDDEDVAEMIALVERINASRVAFASAEKFKEAGRYPDAIKEYAKVIEEDTTYYQLAQQSLTDTIALYREDSLATARVYEASAEYAQAKDILEDALEVLPNDSELISELNVVEAYIQDELFNATIGEIETAINEQRYEDAFELIDDAIEEYPNNADVLSLQETLIETYKSKGIEEAEALYASDALDEAIARLTEMGVYLPNDTEIAELIALYESYIPVALSSLTIYETNGSTYSRYDMSVTMTDTYENTYIDAISLKTTTDWDDDAWGELVFLNNGNYNRISGILAYEYCTNTKGVTHIEIYADDLLVYTSPLIDDSTKPFEFEALLGDECHKLTIRWHSDARKPSNLIFADAQVYNR